VLGAAAFVARSMEMRRYRRSNASRPPSMCCKSCREPFVPEGYLSLDLGLSASSRQRHNELGIAVHYDVGVVCNYDDLPALLDGA